LKAYVYPAKLTVAAIVALAAARMLRLPEVYWAVISAYVVMQVDFGASLATSWQRLVGTALGAACGALVAEGLGRKAIVFALGVLVVGILSVVLRIGRPGNRFAAIAFTIVVLIVRPVSPWVVALHRFLEVSVGILVGLVLSALWPESTPGPALASPPVDKPQSAGDQPGKPEADRIGQRPS
jgi:uncharacterized membrane protein YgaE (UPF0421/DUF939 family)